MFEFSAHRYPYASQRQCVYARNGMVSTTQPLAAQVGIEMIKRGGNAIDAAIAAAITLTVVEPTGCAVGGDAFALVWVKGQLHGLDASGYAPAELSIEALHARGHQRMPLYGWEPVTVPGCPAAWRALSARFGKLPFDELFKPAIKLAEEGFPVSPVVARQWQQALDGYQQHYTPLFDAWFKTFLLEGRAPRAGEIFRNPDLAKTLRELAASKVESFYRGELAQRLVAFSRATGGYLCLDDLQAYQPRWVTPLRLNYRGYDIWEIPPSGQGLIALMTLNTLQAFNFSQRDHELTWHRQLEAMKMAYADGQHYITDADEMRLSAETLLSPAWAKRRRDEITHQAQPPQHAEPQSSGTVYLACADGEGNMVSFIQSAYHGFGSGVVLPGSGIALQNRGSEFSLDPAHANCLRPGKKTFHTIIPGFISKGDCPLGPFGVMGGYMQPQGHVQVVMNLIDFGLNPQAALDAPRWQWLGNMQVGLEQHTPQDLALALAQRGHQVRIDCDSLDYGRGQIILRDPGSGILCGGCEPRADSCIAVC